MKSYWWTNHLPKCPLRPWWELEAHFLFLSPSSLCPLFLSPPLILPAIDGRERFTVRGHTVVLISLSRLGGISTSFAGTHHRVPQLRLTKQREGSADGQPTSVAVCLSVPPSVSLRPFLSVCLGCSSPGVATQEDRTHGGNLLVRSIMMTTFQQWF